MPQMDPLELSVTELRSLLASSRAYFPELEHARTHLEQLQRAPQLQVALAQSKPLLETIAQIPITAYTPYRRFRRDGNRGEYEALYFRKREYLAVVSLYLFLGQTQYRDLVQDYIWSICEETNWVLPAHEMRIIDLFSAYTGMLLAETLALLGDTLDEEVRHRVRMEVERRVFDPYLRFHDSFGWYMGGNNWNGVCNSSIATTFLWLEPEPNRQAKALQLALAGLKVFLNTAFEPDGSSTEGVAYWHYGLINFVALSEMLYARSNGAINLLDSEHMHRIAAYPAKMQLSGATFASFSDCHETVEFNPGIIARLAKRMGEKSLFGLLAHTAAPGSDSGLPMMLRDILWWDGTQPDTVVPSDAYLPSAGTARLVAHTPRGAAVALAMKAGHNAENHNQNDIGSFIVHVDGENLLTDPGPGLYSRQYFSPERYENVFANSYGHSVPRISGQLQGAGREYTATVLNADTTSEPKHFEIEFARAYPLPTLASARRTLTLSAQGGQSGTIWLQDEFRFNRDPGAVEEAFVTWLDVQLDGGTAIVHGAHHDLRLTIEEPADARFRLESLDAQSKANEKPAVLRRLTYAIPTALSALTRVKMELVSPVMS